MTQDEFLKRYHSYRVSGIEAAEAEAALVNDEGIEGNSAVAVDFGGLGCTILLKSVRDLMLDLGMIGVNQARSRSCQ